ncbi:MAG: hypothetical protein WD069_20355 [Planctomycetales bacterium]
MLHFSCDLCGRQLGDRRFVVKMEVFPAFDADEIGDEDLDVDHLQEIADAIAEMEATGKVPLDDCGTKHLRFDLCPHCHRKFAKDPLGRESLRRLNFSEN